MGDTHTVREEAGISAEALLQFLEDPASYPHHPAHVEIIQTHISYVALAPPFVYKVKKPVSLGFLDFSTLEKRRYYCEQEVALNRRLAPGIYEGVVPIYRVAAGLTLEEGGTVVAYAVRMKQLADGYFMHQLLREGRLGTADIDRLMEVLLPFYAGQRSTASQANWGRIGHLAISTDENFEQTEAYLDTLIAQPAYEAIWYYTNWFYEHHALLLERRRAEGHILNCHGDLHLEHIHLAPEQVSIYDCIEFNERFRSIDVANDIAFLAMDLDLNSRPDLAHYFVCGMAEALDDPELLRLIDFYKCYRAYVRAKVESMRSADPDVPEAERQASTRRARRYYQLALHYAVAGSGPMVAVVMGRVGTGKSTVARELGVMLGWPVCASDRIRKQTAGVPLYERGDADERARLYADAQTERTYAALLDQALERATHRQSIVLDATFSRRHHREALRQALRARGISYVFLEMTASDEVIRERLQQREADARVVSDARLGDFEMLAARYEAPDALEDAWHLPVSTEASLQVTLFEVMQRLIPRTHAT